ncbi:MAG: restriction endonuclease subunit S [Methylobacter sp.]|nr:MAG: restriction endonuclease subunit S [Methylobacter sp.]
MDWPILPLEECLDALIDYRGKTPEKTNSGIPLVTAKIIKGGRIEKASEFISKDGYDAWMRRGIPQAGDVVMTTEAPLGEVAQLGKEKIALAQRVVTLRGKSGLLDSTYLLYLLQTEEMQEQLKARATGTTVLGIKQSELRKISVTLPPIDLQRSSASVLAAIDARIDILRETNATLEAIAQALFKSWFVDFDPVRAKQQGREPEGAVQGCTSAAEGRIPVAALDTETAALFPDSFEESELGLVPKGWRAGNIGDNAIYLSRGISPKYLEEGGVLVINQKCIRDFILDLSKARRHDPLQRKIDGRELSIGDILVNSTGVGTLGRVAQVLSSDELMIVDSHVTVIRASENLTWNYLGLSMMRRQVEIESLGEGSTGQTELNRSKLAALKLIIPPKEILLAFDEIALPLRQRFAGNLKQAQTLATLRDTLLPRLISGQLRLPDTAEIGTETINGS